jgi:hypothetical protein
MDAPVLREPLCTANPMNPILEIASFHTLEDPCRSLEAVGPDRRSSRALRLLWRGIIEENREYEVKTEAPEVKREGWRIAPRTGHLIVPASEGLEKRRKDRY